MHHTGGDPPAINSVISLSCDPCYQLIGPATATCQYNGKSLVWNTNVPSSYCKRTYHLPTEMVDKLVIKVVKVFNAQAYLLEVQEHTLELLIYPAPHTLTSASLTTLWMRETFSARPMLVQQLEPGTKPLFPVQVSWIYFPNMPCTATAVILILII